jgi:hypothetical protein
MLSALVVLVDSAQCDAALAIKKPSDICYFDIRYGMLFIRHARLRA